MKAIIVKLTAAGIAGLALISLSCGHSSVTAILNAEDRYALGKQKYLSHDYLEAINEFEVIRLQFPGSSIADSAQYYLGECHFQQEEFLLAAEEYQTLRRTMPASPLVPIAQYKIALCYFNLSPNSPLDQEYTTRAIDEFQTFIEYYPTNDLVKDAETKINDLNTKLARKLFETGQLYMKMSYYSAAISSYNLVMKNITTRRSPSLHYWEKSGHSSPGGNMMMRKLNWKNISINTPPVRIAEKCRGSKMISISI